MVGGHRNTLTAGASFDQARARRDASRRAGGNRVLHNRNDRCNPAQLVSSRAVADRPRVARAVASAPPGPLSRCTAPDAAAAAEDLARRDRAYLGVWGTEPCRPVGKRGAVTELSWACRERIAVLAAGLSACSMA